MKALTRQQSELLRFITEYQQCENASPSFDEMREAMGLKSKSGIYRLVSGLEERGFIRRIHYKARCIEVVPDAHLPETPLTALPMHALVAEVKRRGFTVGSVQWHRASRQFKELAL